MTDIIELKKYDSVLEHGVVKYYAITKKGERIEMLPQYKDFYDDEHLAITMTDMKFPEVYDIPEDKAKHYVPLMTTEFPPNEPINPNMFRVVH